MPAAVTPSGVRDGDPAALAGLCAARGPSALAYCRHVAGDANASAAAAQAFAAFRAAVVATRDLTDLNPEALLVNAVRRAAARHAPHAQLGVCAVVPLLLAARAEKTLSIADGEVLEQHLEGCWSCRAPVARFDAAERAYRDPPDSAIDPGTVAAIVAAMAAAAPAPGAEPPVAATNGSGPDVAAAAAAAGAPAAAPADQATAAFHTPGAPEPGRAAAPEAAGSTAVEPARRARRTGFAPALLGSLGGRRGSAARRPGTSPRPPAQPSAAASRLLAAGRSRPRRMLRLPIVLPVVVVLLALLVALFLAGVIGGSDPASSPRIAVPADAPADGGPSEAEVVVVPGTEDAGADDVERAKERARDRRRRAAPDGAQPAAATPSAKPPPATPPPATPPPAATTRPAPRPAPAPPPAPRERASDDAGGSGRTLDAGNGATGAEQIPPAEDNSSVPDLAPPPEPVTAP